jgi:hypothetical protein
VPIGKATRGRKLVYAAAAIAVLSGGATAVVLVTGASDRTAPPQADTGRRVTHALPRSNLRVLTAAQTRRLLVYASSLKACLYDRGVATAPPAKQARAITLETSTSVGRRRLVGLVLPCAEGIGDPPSPSSLQVVDARTIALSVPKQCLLDPKVEA